MACDDEAIKLADKIKLVGFKDGAIELKYNPGSMIPDIPVTLIPMLKDEGLPIKLKTLNIFNTVLGLSVTV